MKQMEGLIYSQHEDHKRVARTVDNLKKLGKSRITISSINDRLTHLNERWHSMLGRHDTLTSGYRQELLRHEYGKADVFTAIEATYWEQRDLLREMLASLESPATEMATGSSLDCLETAKGSRPAANPCLPSACRSSMAVLRRGLPSASCLIL